MSKRAAGVNFGSGEERYGGQLAHTMDGEKPAQATAAQLARRKIAQARKPGVNRARSGSPAIPPNNTGNISGGLFGNSNPQQQTQNPFQSSNFSFTFGGAPQQQEASASPTPFQFGSSAPPPTQPQANGNGNIFGNSTPSFGTSFNAGPAQPQQNGFTPTNSSVFNQPTQNTNSTSFSFGQSQQTQQNGFTPATATSSTFGSFGKPQDNTPNNQTSFNFGSTQQEKDKAGTPLGGFGASQQDKEKSSNPFGGFGGTQQDRERSNTPFGGFGAAQAEKEKTAPANPFAGFGASKQATQEPKAPAQFTGFGQTQQDGANKPNNLFSGIGQKPQENGEKQENPFAGFGQKKPDTAETPTMPSFSGFGQQKPLFQQQNGDTAKKPEIQPASNPFSGFGQPQTNGEKPGSENISKAPAFSFGQTSASESEKSIKSNIFGGLSQPAQSNGENKGLFGASLFPASTPTGAESIFSNLPKKDLSNGGKPLFDSSDPSQIYREEDDHEEINAANNGTSNIFGQLPKASSQPAGSSFKPASDNSTIASSSIPQKSLFPAATPSQTLEKFADNTPAPSRSLFDRVDKDDVAKRNGTASSETPKASFFNTAPATPATVKAASQPSASTTGSMFKPAQPSQLSQSQTPATPPSRSLFDRVDKAAPQPTGPAQAPAASSGTISSATTVAPALITTPSSPAPGTSLLTQPSGVSPTVSLTDPQKVRIKDLNQAILSVLQTESLEKDWTVIFDYYAKTAAEIRGLPPPAPQAPSLDALTAINSTNAAASGKLASQTDSTGAQFASTPAASSKSNLFSKPPSTAPVATKKRPFEEEEGVAAQAPNTEKRSKLGEPVSYPKLPENASSTAKLFEAALGSTKPVAASATKSLFSTSASQNPTSSSSSLTPKPASGGFKPSFGGGATGSGSFLSAFGNKAKQQAEKDRKRRKDEDYDSEEETEEQWEKRDQEEQEAKRKKLEEAAKNAKGFVLTGSSTSTGNSEAKTPFKFTTSTTDTASTTPAAPPPKFNNLFGSTPTSSVEPSKLAPPATGFSFGPKATASDASRATTPGVTTDGEASTAADGEDGESSDEQGKASSDMDDHTALQASERDASDVLLELQNTTTKTFRKTEDSEKPVWAGVGSGRLYVLKDKATGKTRVLNRVGVGRTALNFNPLKGLKYEKHPKKNTMVIAPFMDHLHSSPARLERFYITAETAAEATELARLLTEGVPK